MASGQVMGQPGALASPAMGGLSTSNLSWSLQRSLIHLGVETVDVFYLHQPDPETCLEETLRACHELHQQNKFKRLGLSNYMAEEVAEACRLCGARGLCFACVMLLSGLTECTHVGVAEENGWIAPTLYQGNYSAFNRDVEEELMPVLKQNGVDFYAYNPLMAGILSGKYSTKDDIDTDKGDGSSRPGVHNRLVAYSSTHSAKIYIEAVVLIVGCCEMF